MPRADLTKPKPCSGCKVIIEGGRKHALCKECARVYARERRKRTYPAESNDKRYAKFGITVSEFEEMLEAQGKVCAICEEPESATTNGGGRVRQLSIDHSHSTGKVRGLLCSRCNTGLGLFRDRPDLLDSARRYLAEREGW